MVLGLVDFATPHPEPMACACGVHCSSRQQKIRCTPRVSIPAWRVSPSRSERDHVTSCVDVLLCPLLSHGPWSKPELAHDQNIRGTVRATPPALDEIVPPSAIHHVSSWLARTLRLLSDLSGAIESISAESLGLAVLRYVARCEAAHTDQFMARCLQRPADQGFVVSFAAARCFSRWWCCARCWC